MATEVDNELTDLKAELTIVNETIKKVNQNGQGFEKGGRSGFKVELAQLPALLNQRRELKDKIRYLEQ